MENEQLKSYIEHSRQSGLTDDAIKDNLRSAGWQDSAFEGAFTAPSSIFAPTLPDFPQAEASQASGSGGGFLADKKRLLLFGGSGFGIILVVSILIGYLAFYPGYVKGQMIKGLSKIQMGKMKSEVVISDKDNHTSKVNVSGFFNYKDAKNPKLDLSLGVDVPLGEGVSLSGEANVKRIGDKAYAEMTKAPNLGIIDLSGVKDKWVYLDLSSKEAMGSSEVKAIDSVDTKEIVKSLSDGKIFKKFKKVKGEKIEGVDCHKFTFVIDKSKLPDFLAKATKAQGDQNTQGEIDSLKKEMEDSLKDVDSIDGSISVGKSDYIMRSLSLQIKGKQASTVFTLKLSDIGKDQEVTAPKDAKTLDALVSDLTKSMNASSNNQATTAPQATPQVTTQTTSKTTSQNLITLTDNTFRKEVLEYKGVVLVEFYLTTCTHCQAVAPQVASAADQLIGKAKVGKLDAKASITATQYKVEGVPTFIVFKNGEKKETVMGERNADQLLAMVRKYL